MQEFANKCGLSKGYVSMLEHGQHPQNMRPLNPSIETMKQIARGMGIEVDALINSLEDEKEVEPSSEEVEELKEIIIHLKAKLYDYMTMFE